MNKTNESRALSVPTGSAPSSFHCGKCGKLKLTRTGKPHKCAHPTGWQPPETAPVGPLILADFGWPTPVMAMWCGVSEKWAAVSANRDHTNDDAWFETEYERADDLRRWMHLPSLPNNRDEPTLGRAEANKSKKENV